MATVTKREWTYKGERKSAWVVRYVDNGGEQRSRQFGKKKDADAYRLQVENEKVSNLHVAASRSVTVAQLATEFLALAAVRHRDGRRMGDSYYRSLTIGFRTHIVPGLGSRLVRDLTFKEVSEWAIALTTTKRLAPSSAKRQMQFLSGALEFAVRRGYVHRNVAQEVMKEHRGGERKPIRTFTSEEVKRLLASVRTRVPYQAERTCLLISCFVHIATLAGLRFGEISGLTVENVDFDNRVIQVRHNLAMNDLLKGPKTKAGIRDVPMAGVLAELLREWIARFYIPNDRGLIFRGKGGGYIHPPGFHRNYWHKALRRAGMGPDDAGDWHHFHALRHFCASAMIAANVPLTDVAALLGHSAFDVTLQVYAHTIAGGRRRMDVLDSIAASYSQPLQIAQEMRTAA